MNKSKKSKIVLIIMAVLAIIDLSDIIINLATNGRLELQEHAKEFIKNNC